MNSKIAKILALMLVFVMVLGLFAGCGKKEEAPAEEPKTETEAPKEETKTEEPKEEEKEEANAVGAGMGTAGLVGPLAAYAVMGPQAAAEGETWMLIVRIVGLYFIAPAVICLALDAVTRHLGWVTKGDMKLDR